MSLFIDELSEYAYNALLLKDAPKRFFLVKKSDSEQKELYFLQILDKSFARFQVMASMERLEVDKGKLPSSYARHCSTELMDMYTFVQGNPYLQEIIEFLVSQAVDSLASTDVACCSHYLECSDQKQCVQNDIMLKFKCYYRTNLRAGRIFYGRNMNI